MNLGGKFGETFVFVLLWFSGDAPISLPRAVGRGRGIGSLLVKEAERLFRSWGCRYSTASTQSSNKASLALFKKLGYRVYRRNTREFRILADTLYAYEDDVIFLKKL